MNNKTSKLLRKIIEKRHNKKMPSSNDRKYFIREKKKNNPTPLVLYAEPMRREYKWLKKLWKSLPRKERRKLLCGN